MTIIGIDLGTTNSCMAFMNEEGKPVIITDIGGRSTIPSIVSFSKDKNTGEVEKLSGHSAYQKMLVNTENTVTCVKRLIGHSYKSPVINQLLPTLPFKLIPRENNEGIEIYIPATDKKYTPEEISSYILTELRATAEKKMGEPVSKAVITVPAYFNNKQRQATKDAALIAGLDVMRIINEPTAAAMAYGFSREDDEEKLLAIFDFGGGTFDITLMEVTEGILNVIATAGNTFLGGEDITTALFEHLIGELSMKHNIQDLENPVLFQRLRDYAETAKKDLTTQKEISIEVPYITKIDDEHIHFKATVTRELLEELASPFVNKAVATFKRTIKEVALEESDLSGIILIGGQTRMPMIQKALKELCPNVPVLKDINPDETVAIGAAIQADLLDDREGGFSGDDSDMLLLDVTPHNLGIAVGADTFYTLIPRNSTVPTSTEDIFVTSHDNQERAKIMLLQGDSKKASENEMLGEFELTGLRKAPRGEVKIKIIYEIDVNGIVTVEAIDLDTNQKQKISVSSTSNLSDEDLSDKIKENSDYYLDLAEKSMAEDLLGTVEDLIYRIEQIKPRVIQILSKNELMSDKIDKMEAVISSTKNYIKQDSIELEKLQDLETKLDNLFQTYSDLIEEEEGDGCSDEETFL